MTTCISEDYLTGKLLLTYPMRNHFVNCKMPQVICDAITVYRGYWRSRDRLAQSKSLECHETFKQFSFSYQPYLPLIHPEAGYLIPANEIYKLLNIHLEQA